MNRATVAQVLGGGTRRGGKLPAMAGRSVTAGRFIAIHGHFYQPPRENPWLEAVEVQDSAAPYHDWNDRVTAECYAPNTAARRVGQDNRIIDIVNNFEKISFNVGPTLLSWLDRHAPAVYQSILEADRRSAHAHGGHGNAIAQVYNHMILPLASRRDKVTQVLWGRKDFQERFGRDPEGMWLPETGVDNESLDVLADAGMKFTILAPHQAWRIRRIGTEAWQEVNDRVDPSRPYLWRGPGGRTLSVFFYDGPISRAIAFENALDRGENLVARLKGGFVADRDGAQLIHCATDGESYGHHKPFGDMALAAAIAQIEAEGFAVLTNYGAFLAEQPPAFEVQIRELTSWSCAHGVERWRGDCGCKTRADWHQRWRGPLREALDWLREEIDAFYESRASALLKSPWEARDAYIDVILDRSPDGLATWLARHRRVLLDAAAQVETRQLLEMARHRLLMYTSCGWFFDEISALEPTQILKYAAMALQYLRDLGGGDLEDEFVRRLEAAPTNVAVFANGGEVYRALIRPAVVDLRRVVAHYAISGLFEEYPDEASVHAWRVKRLDDAGDNYDVSRLRIGRVRAASEITGQSRDLQYTVLHFGGHDFSCGIRTYEDPAAYDTMKADLLRRYAQRSMADTVRGLDEHFPEGLFSLTHLFLEQRRRVLASVMQAVLDKHEQTYRPVWEESRKLVRYLRQADALIPEVLRITAKYMLEEELVAELKRAAYSTALPERVFEVSEEARSLGLELDSAAVRPIIRLMVGRGLDALAERVTAERVAPTVTLVLGARRLGFGFGLWHTQNRVFALWRDHPEARETLRPLVDALDFALADQATP
jgi:alpha-amylase/alpha-mannosidase (GH57 family)